MGSSCVLGSELLLEVSLLLLFLLVSLVAMEGFWEMGSWKEREDEEREERECSREGMEISEEWDGDLMCRDEGAR